MLLTRSPLGHPPKEGLARLACVKHAASVRPEPGSNSPLNVYKPRTQPEGQARDQQNEEQQTTEAACRTWTQKRGLASPSLHHKIYNTAHNTHPHQPQRPARASATDQMALTFSTLLSSQRTNTHLHKPSGLLRGNLIDATRPASPCQTGSQPAQHSSGHIFNSRNPNPRTTGARSSNSESRSITSEGAGQLTPETLSVAATWIKLRTHGRKVKPTGPRASVNHHRSSRPMPVGLSGRRFASAL